MTWALSALAVFGALALLIGIAVIRARRNETPTLRRAREHNRTRTDLPRMCGECGAYMLEHGSVDYRYWICPVCVEEQELEAARRKREAKEHNERIRAARREADSV